MSSPHKPKTTLPAFTPVPRKTDRSNGWKPEVQLAFIEALAETGSVTAAARRVNRAAVGAYLLRRHPEAKSFRKAWEAALDIGMQRVEDVAMDRALNGVEVPVYAYGKIIGTRTVYNDRLLMFMLRNRAPKRFAADGAKGMNALDKHRLAQMKKEWRKEWDRERLAAKKKDSGETLDRLHAKIDKMRERRDALMSPETRRLREAYEASFERDKAEPYAWMDEADASPGADAQVDNDMGVLGPSEEMKKHLPGWQEAEPEGEEDGPRVRRVKDDGW
ncbi:hypothetical protein [Aurantiacibacter sp. D1-12]|uniref:hypothetical protein n=1 Tax=Aurantiacibacter sp. D1-12 TaxID=2993658 RepID=UPI00237CE78A|nr:hypothetical protein [Aurantiacibacter sp. D1-12]MDE1468323.1 hypothetical protein [Aurantiacibacter sp. D1-12]